MTPLERVLKQALEQRARQMAAHYPERAARQRYTSFEALVLERGRLWQPAPLPPFIQPGEMRYCYQNTLDIIRQMRSLGCLELDYCEGFALPLIGGWVGIPVFHAWAVDALETVWDATWPMPEHSAYYGIRFDWSSVERFDALGPDYLGLLESDYLRQFPLLRTGELFPEGWPASTRAARSESS